MRPLRWWAESAPPGTDRVKVTVAPVTPVDTSLTLDAVGWSGILKAKQKLGVTFNFNKQDVIDFTKFSKMTMCRASEANS